METIPMLFRSLLWTLMIPVLLSSNKTAAQSTCIARQCLGSAGCSVPVNANGQTLLIQQSIGQGSVIGTHSYGAATLRQGFIQPQVEREAARISAELLARVYPNPFNQSFEILFEEELLAGGTISINDLSGRLVYTQLLGAGNRMFVSAVSFSPGAYTIRLEYLTRVFTSTIIKK